MNPNTAPEPTINYSEDFLLELLGICRQGFTHLYARGLHRDPAARAALDNYLLVFLRHRCIAYALYVVLPAPDLAGREIFAEAEEQHFLAHIRGINRAYAAFRALLDATLPQSATDPVELDAALKVFYEELQQEEGALNIALEFGSALAALLEFRLGDATRRANARNGRDHG